MRGNTGNDLRVVSRRGEKLYSSVKTHLNQIDLLWAYKNNTRKGKEKSILTKALTLGYSG